MKVGIIALSGAVFLMACCAQAADWHPPTRQKYKSGDGINKYDIYPKGHISKTRLVWKSECLQPEGKGLALDGLDQATESARPHTRIRVDGKWVNIYPDLRKKNPLQTHCDRAHALTIDLMRARAHARHIWFKGLGLEAERKRLDAEAVTLFQAFLTNFEKLTAELENTAASLPAYEKHQAGVALRHFAAASELLKTGAHVAKGSLEADTINAMQKAQIQIEIGAEALDAEPGPRVLSMPAYDAKTGLYVLFGGGHFDYISNDTWVFDPKQKKWFQKHPESAPPPRGRHLVNAPGDGTVQIHGGYCYPARHRYTWIGNDVWTYDIAKNTWTGPEKAKPMPPDTRTYRGKNEHPSWFLQGEKPNAAEHEKFLLSIPVNTWVSLKPPYLPEGRREWGTKALDLDNDLIAHWNGGHSGYCSSDAPHYHLGTNRWELAYPAEFPLGMAGASAKFVAGYSFNHRHWITNHTWNNYLYDRKLKRVVVTGALCHNYDPYFYLYNTVLGEWETRYRKYGHMHKFTPMVTATPYGTVAFVGSNKYYLLDYDKMRFNEIAVGPKSKDNPMPLQAGADNCGQVYDPKRERLLILWRYHRNLYNGREIIALDMKKNIATRIAPKNPEILNKGLTWLREIRYIPDFDIFLIGDGIHWANPKVKPVPGRTNVVAGNKMAAYDPNKNCWLALDIKGPRAYGNGFGMRYDAKRKLIWGVGTRGDVYVLKLDLEKAIMQSDGATGG